jgi:hypothetical protein
MQGITVTHLGFVIDSIAIEVRLPPNKAQRTRDAVEYLIAAKSTITRRLNEILSFLSHYSQVVPLDRSFLRSLFSLHHVI